jgi:hypothetical protein
LLGKTETVTTRTLFRYLSAFLVALCVPASSHAEEDFRIWENMTAIINLGSVDKRLDKWRWWVEAQGRFRENGGAADQALARTGLGYQLTDKASVWLGFAYVGNYPNIRRNFDEYRAWQQLMIADKPSFGDVTSRTRLEQRFIEGINPVEWRLRQFVRFARPIYDGSPVSVVLWDEVFVRINSPTPATPFGFDQNRGFAGLGYTFSNQLRIEVGYMNQFLLFRTLSRREQRFDQRMNHILSLSMFLNL